MESICVKKEKFFNEDVIYVSILNRSYVRTSRNVGVIQPNIHGKLERKVIVNYVPLGNQICAELFLELPALKYTRLMFLLEKVSFIHGITLYNCRGEGKVLRDTGVRVGFRDN